MCSWSGARVVRGMGYYMCSSLLVSMVVFMAVEIPREVWEAGWIDGVFGGALVVLWPLAAELKCVSLPLQAQVRMRGAGLGAKGSSYGVSTADSYKDAVRKAMFARFTEME